MTRSQQFPASRPGRLLGRARRALTALALAVAVVIAALLSALSASALASGASPSPRAGTPVPGPARVVYHRGALISATPVARRSAASVRRTLRRTGVATSTVRDPVTAWRLMYRTITPQGRPTRASGLLVLPRGTAGGRGRVPLAVYEHGTQTLRADAPSEPTANDGWVSGLGLGSSGLATVAPDYLGLGTGPGPHPYLDAASETSDSVDMLHAARMFTARRGVSLSRRVMVTGFSQGGAAAVAVAHALQDNHPGGLSLAGLAPVSGPYDLPGVELPAITHGRLDHAVTPYYIGYLLTAWQRRLHLLGSPRAIFRPPYAARARTLYDGRHDLGPIVAALPHTLERLLTPQTLAELHDPTGRLAAALRAQAVCDGWRPDVPVHMFAARGDRVVPIANARSCATALRAHGATVSLTDVGDVGHIHSQIRALPRVTALFDRLAGVRPRG